MLEITKSELDKCIRLHGLWLNGDQNGRRANLSDTDLSGAELFGINLSGADLRNADLRNADLSCSNLSGANLSGANLFDADLSCANLSGADLSDTNLSCANLKCINIEDAIDGYVCRMDFGKYSICIRSKKTSIGCRKYDNDKWLNWSADDDVVKYMSDDASEWWRVHGDAVKSAIRCVMDKAKKTEAVEAG